MTDAQHMSSRLAYGRFSDFSLTLSLSVVDCTCSLSAGKSSTINVLAGAKKVTVGATPGKTKHFQTINVTDQLTLCDWYVIARMHISLEPIRWLYDC